MKSIIFIINISCLNRPVCWIEFLSGTEIAVLASRHFLTHVFQTSDELICGQ